MQYIVATHNAHKLKELSRILRPLGIEAVTDRELGVTLSEVEETGTSFEDNAFLKADAACRETGLPAIADDSGLCVDALDGAPGIYSARYAGEGASDGEKIQKLLAAMSGVPAEKRSARFVSAICCVFPNGERLTARGVCDGVIADAPRGQGGFGYDPVFLVGEKSYAELSPDEKDAVSHRGRSLRLFSEKLKAYLSQQGSCFDCGKDR
ncbi:MAG: RdgB/HAM1 family non-canonical purine NTP pyrophosphatase [Acutalibacteraceae bacterium]